MFDNRRGSFVEFVEKIVEMMGITKARTSRKRETREGNSVVADANPLRQDVGPRGFGR